MDDEGYLCFPGVGRVLDAEGNPIVLGTDKLDVDVLGNISQADGGFLGRLGVYALEDVEMLEHTEQSFFAGETPPWWRPPRFCGSTWSALMWT